jgi:hypothetical protein
MSYRLLADLVVALHGVFVLFVVFGGLLALRHMRWAWVHIPAAIWGAFIEFAGWICPLTPLENHFRRLAGERGYPEGFIEHYVYPLMYPAGLTRPTQFVLGSLVIAINLIVYAVVVRRALKSRRPPA